MPLTDQYSTVFKISTDGQLTTLYSFPGGILQAAPVQGSDGYFYGTSSAYYSTNYYNPFPIPVPPDVPGMVFRISTNGTLTMLSSFWDNANGLMQDSDGNLYGTTSFGGTNGYGYVFEISTNGTMTTLYSFTGGSDGANSYAPLVQGSDGSFYGTASGGGLAGAGSVFKLTILLELFAQPQSQWIALGSNATLSVEASGTGMLDYQWYFHGTPLPGQTNAALLISRAAFTNAGAYNVVVTNLYSSVTSAVALVVVGFPPGINVQPVSQTNLINSSATFLVAPSGTGPFTYQWQFNGTNLPNNNIIDTVAGNGKAGFSGDGGAATTAELSYPQGVAVDASGNLFIADSGNGRVRKVSTNGIISTVASNGPPGSLNGVAVDGSGNLYLADSQKNRIHKVNTNGIITTVTGNGTNGFFGDGGAAIAAELRDPQGVAVDAFGNLFIADSGNSVIRKVDTNGIITTVAGNGTNGYSGDGGAATKAELAGPVGVAVDAFGNLFIADSGSGVIRKVDPNAIITTVAGGGNSEYYSGDGGAATNAALNYPSSVAVDAFGDLFIADQGDDVIQKGDPNGRITTVAGGGNSGYYDGDGGPAIYAGLSAPAGVALDPFGNLLIADSRNNAIREVFFARPRLVLNNLSGVNAGWYDVVISSPYGSVTSSIVNLVVLLPPAISTQPQSQAVVLGANAKLTIAVAGTEPFDYQWYFDGTPLLGQTNTNLLFNDATFTNAGAYYVVVTNLYGAATSAVAMVTVGLPPGITVQPTSLTNLLNSPATFAVAVSGTGPFTYEWQFNGTYLPDGIINTVAGNGTNGYSGDGGPATNAELANPQGVAVDASGNLFIADLGNKVIRKVGTNGIIMTVAGNGTNGYSGDGGSATTAELQWAGGVAVDASGNLFIADVGNSRIRKVGADGIITTVAGNSTYGYAGDGGAATNAELSYPQGVGVDVSGNLFIGDSGNNRIRKVGADGIITTVAGNGITGYSGDDGAATNAELNYPQGVGVDASGNLFIGDSGNSRIRKVGTNGIINTVAGNAELNPVEVTVDVSGDLFIADGSNRVRRVGINGIISTVAGNGIAGYSGDGRAATDAELKNPVGVAVDGHGNLFLADSGNSAIREVVSAGPTLVLNNLSGANAGLYDVVISSPYGSVTSSIVTLVLPPTISTQPQSQTAAIGASATLTVAAAGSQPINYQWYFDGTPLPDQTNTTFLMSGFAYTNAGSYFAVATNFLGSATSAVAVVTVVQPPIITAQPVSQTNLFGSTASFSVSVSGTGPVAYQWQFKGTNLPPGAGATLVLPNVSVADAGLYDVVVSSPYGSVTSSNVNLVVTLPPLNTLRLNASIYAPEGLILHLQGAPGIPYVLLSATNLTPPVNWRPVFTNVASPNGSWGFIVSNIHSSPARFYRMSTTGH